MLLVRYESSKPISKRASTSIPQSEEVTLELTALYTLDLGVLSSLPYNSILWQWDMGTSHN